ncbi:MULTISPECIES: hypothetical protein [Streptomyces]|uniref:DUF308 domain-containing protein n=1 Tax=Streptomyces hydrogenans TaxID=1873719 RepID=A0ABQ3P915_9ACTN|nr:MULTISPECIES: hypothetical protein [Streptomyces]MCM1947842.1 hypothetical protein [Streptomyces sp. G2]GHG11078.1 hypothetical protein GCM10018784_24650 [Streptomyces hydrogenans]GHI21516.1 hypothetical protein Shyd_28870 [Streptomyces hydrogenans]
MADQQDGGEREPQPIDEEAAWAAIVAGYGEEPVDPPGARPYRPIENLRLPEPEELEAREARAASGADVPKPDKTKREPAPAEPEPEAGDDDGPGDARPALGSSITFAPGVRPSGGPRDYSLSEPEEGPGGADEGHFVPPEPPPLPEADTTTKFAWLAVVGGPVLMLLAVLLRWDMTWWLTTLCIGGFLGGFVTLVARMKGDDEDGDGYDDPGRGAVV